MAGIADGYDLRWKDHTAEVFSQVRSLRSKDHFSDVTVHCDGRNFRAHKVLLAASSDFFERVFLSAPRERSQVVVMAETPGDILELLLNFIYDGETYVSAESLDKFMDVAEKLGIRGLRKVSEDNDPARNEARKRVHETVVEISRKRPRISRPASPVTPNVPVAFNTVSSRLSVSESFLGQNLC
jgi:hypothetical protein